VKAGVEEGAAAGLSCALGLREPQLVAFVGAGGKTTALQRLAVESAERGSCVAVTTTTAMYAHQLASVAPLFLRSGDARNVTMLLKDQLLRHRIVALAESVGDDGKARGIRPEDVDALWRERLVGFIVVEADGSRGLPLKMFGAAEPQLPSETTTVVVMAGMDALDAPLDDRHVHRAELLRSLLSVAQDGRATPGVVARTLAVQVARVRSLCPRADVAVLLNKADTGREMAAGLEIAGLLDDACDAREGRPAGAARPDRVVVGSLSRDVYRVATGGPFPA